MGSHDDFRYIGENLLLSIAGFSPARYCIDRLPVYLSHIPAGTSIQNIIHFAQVSLFFVGVGKYLNCSQFENAVTVDWGLWMTQQYSLF